MSLCAHGNARFRLQTPGQRPGGPKAISYQLNGTIIKEGDLMVLLLGAANRDPEVFPDPDRFDITRDTKKHLAYGHGIHHCLGSSLADTEGQVAVGTLLKRMPDLRLLDQKIEIRPPFALRGPKALMVAPK